MKFYKGYRGDSEQEKVALENEFERLKSLDKEQKDDDKIRLSNFGNAFSNDVIFEFPVKL